MRYPSPVPAARCVYGVILGSLAASACSSGTTDRPSPAAAAACSSEPLPSTIVDLPFAPEHRGFAGWIDDHRAVIAEWVDDRDTGPRVRAVMIDAERATVKSLGEPVHPPRYASGSANAVFATVAGKLVVIVSSTVGSEPVYAFVVDPDLGAATAVPPADQPPSSAFLTSPLRVAIAGERWGLWPISNRGVELGAGYVLDVAAARWRRVTTRLAPRAGAHVAALDHHRVALWGGREGDVPSTGGVVLDLATGASVPFAHPGAPTSLIAAHGTTIAAALAELPRGLSGYVVDVDRGTSADLARPLQVPWRNHHILHGDDAYLAYLASDSLHVRAAATGAWRTCALPFSPDAPSDIEITTLAPGAWLIDGTDRGAFRFDPRAGTFCALTIPRALQAASTVIASSRFRIVVGGVVAIEERPDCPPGAPCALPAARRVVDPRAQIVQLR